MYGSPASGKTNVALGATVGVADTGDFAGQVDLIVLDSATGFYRLERTEAEECEALTTLSGRFTGSGRWMPRGSTPSR